MKSSFTNGQVRLWKRKMSGNQIVLTEYYWQILIATPKSGILKITLMIVEIMQWKTEIQNKMDLFKGQAWFKSDHTPPHV